MSTRLTADERRARLVTTATVEFAERGQHGASTETIAEAAGISHAYLFRLFGTKKALFIACLDHACTQIGVTFEDAAEAHARGDVDAPDALAAMGKAYSYMLVDRRDLLMVQLHGFAAANDPEIRECARRGFGRVWRLVAGLTGCTMAEAQRFFADGMRLNVAAAMRLDEVVGVDLVWASILSGPPLDLTR